MPGQHKEKTVREGKASNTPGSGNSPGKGLEGRPQAVGAVLSDRTVAPCCRDVRSEEAEGVAGILPGLLSYMAAHGPRAVGNQLLKL